MHENRETSGGASTRKGTRPVCEGAKPQGNAHALEESDRAILSMNQTNKEERSSAEPGEIKGAGLPRHLTR